MRVRLPSIVTASLVLAAGAARAGTDDLPPVQGLTVGDFDGDGKPDIATGLPEVNVGKLKKAGEVRIYSGASGALLRKISGVLAEQSFGVSLAAVGDVDGDGATDLAIAAPFGEGDPYVDIVSGRTGKTISKRTPRPTAIQWGDELCALGDGSGKQRTELLVRWVQQKQWRVYYTDKDATAGAVADDSGYVSRATMLGDVDGDGRPDVAISDRWSDTDGKKISGIIRVVSGDLLMRGQADTFLLTLKGAREGEMLGSDVCAAGDWDGDGVADLLASAAGADEKKGSWLVRVFSGKDGSELWKAAGAAGDWHAPSVALVGDADGDGKPDVAVGTPAVGSMAGVVSVLAAKDGAVLWTVKGAAKENLGEEVRRFPDADGDGVADLLVVSPGAAVKFAKGNGYVRILSGKTGAVLLLVNPLVAK